MGKQGTVKSKRKWSKSGERKESVPYDYSQPLDKGWAWMVMIGCFGVAMMTIGGIKSFGVLFVELKIKYDVSNKALQSIQSITGFFYLFLGPVSNALACKFTHRAVICCGGILTSVGLLLSSFSPSVALLYLTYGLITGIGYSLSFTPAVVVITHYFKKRKAIATGVSLSGGGLGAMVMPYIVRYLMNWYGLQGALLIYSAIMSHICIFALLLRPYNAYPLKARVETKTSQNDRTYMQHPESIKLTDVEEKITLNGAVENRTLSWKDEGDSLKEVSVSSVQDLCKLDDLTSPILHPAVQSLLPLHDNNTCRKSDFKSSNRSINSQNRDLSLGVMAAISCQSINVEINEPPDKSSSADEIFPAKYNVCMAFLRSMEWSLFTNPIFVLMFFVILTSMVGYHSIFNIVPPFAKEVGLTGEQGTFILFVFGLSDLLGRVGLGVIMDRCPRAKLASFTIAVAWCCLGVIFTPQFRTLLGLCCFMGSYGFFAGGFNSTVIILLSEMIDVRQLPNAWGFLCMAASVAMFINPTIAGAMKDFTGTWEHSFHVTGSISLLSVVFLVIIPFARRRLKKRSNDEQDKEYAIPEV